MNQQQLIEQKAKELLIQNCGTPTIGDNGEMTADLDYYIESDAALSTMIEFAEWMQGEWERLREDRNNWVAMYQNACKLVRLAHDATERTQKACNRQTFQLAAKENELRKLKKEMAALKRAICHAGVNKQVDFHLPKPPVQP